MPQKKLRISMKLIRVDVTMLVEKLRQYLQRKLINLILPLEYKIGFIGHDSSGKCTDSQGLLLRYFHI